MNFTSGAITNTDVLPGRPRSSSEHEEFVPQAHEPACTHCASTDEPFTPSLQDLSQPESKAGRDSRHFSVCQQCCSATSCLHLRSRRMQAPSAMSSALAVVRLVSACMRRLQDPLRPGNRSCTLKDGRRPFEVLSMAFSLTRCLLAQRLGLLLLPIDSVLVARSSDN